MHRRAECGWTVGNHKSCGFHGGDFVARWSDPRQLATRDIETVQRALQSSGDTRIDKIDGKIGSATRAGIGLWQQARKVAVDCWPTATLLTQMRGAK